MVLSHISDVSEKFNAYEEVTHLAGNLASARLPSSVTSSLEPLNPAKNSFRSQQTPNPLATLISGKNRSWQGLGEAIKKSVPKATQPSEPPVSVNSWTSRSCPNPSSVVFEAPVESRELKNQPLAPDSGELNARLEVRQFEEQLEQLLALLQSNNEAMKKNLKIAQGLKEELDSCQRSYNQLKESSEITIKLLKAENDQLKEKVSQLSITDKPLTDKKSSWDAEHRSSIEELERLISEKDEQLTILSGKLESTKIELEKEREDSRAVEEMKNNCQKCERKHEDEEQFKHGLMNEIEDLKEMVNKLREEKSDLEGKLDENSGHSNGHSLSAKIAKKGHLTDADSEPDQKPRSKHGKHLKKLEKRMKSALPVLNSGILFSGFRQYSTSNSEV